MDFLVFTPFLPKCKADADSAPVGDDASPCVCLKRFDTILDKIDDLGFGGLEGLL